METNKSVWNNDYWKLYKIILNGKRTIQEAKFYMEKNYIYDGNSRTAFNHSIFVNPNDSILEYKLYNQICDAVKLGFGKDINFEKAFR